MYNEPTNPFIYGALALDEAFTDRETELKELAADIRNGQDVLVFAPRRFGKSSLVLRAAQQALAKSVLVAYCDLMKTPTKERFAAALAKTIYDDLASPMGQAAEKAVALFRGLRITPTIEIDPDDGDLRFTFDASRRRASGIDETIERLLELPGKIGADRKRRVAVVFDEFQEVVALDPRFPNLMRAVFQTQPEVAHVYLGSKRHVLERIFSDRNEPFWRSAKRMEIGPIPLGKFAAYIRKRFGDTDKGIHDDALDRLLAATAGHPYGTQELAYFVWGRVPNGHFANVGDVEGALAQVLRSEHGHFSRIWDEATHNERLLLIALADEPSRAYAEDYRARHDLPSPSHIQRAVGALVNEEVIGRDADGVYRIVETFLAEWITQEQAAYDLVRQLRRRSGRRASRA
jgi:AAA+ ATPase superfamily predicted ATPase